MEVKNRDDFENLKKLPFFKGVIVSNSMEPLIKVGDKIIVEVGASDLQRFDIIVFLNDGKLVCHYVWSINQVVMPKLIQTRSIFYGDKDYPILFDDYLGKVKSHKLSIWMKIKIALKDF